MQASAHAPSYRTYDTPAGIVGSNRSSAKTKADTVVGFSLWQG